MYIYIGRQKCIYIYIYNNLRFACYCNRIKMSYVKQSFRAILLKCSEE